MSHTTTGARRRALRTWTALGELGRRPTEYEILTHGLTHTTAREPLELSPTAYGNRWLRAHRDQIPLTVEDWDVFRDPDEMTYRSYVAGQDDQEAYVEGLLERFDEDEYDRELTDSTLDLLRRALTPSRYLAHGLQMLSAYLHQLAPSSYVGNCAVFQTADALRRVQLTAYRTTQLRLTHPSCGFAVAERQDWEQATPWQPVRHAVEAALINYHWDRALVATNLVVKPVTDLLLIEQLGRQCAAVGAHLDALVLANLWRDSRRSQRWTLALLRFLIEADAGNRHILQERLSELAPLGFAIVAASTPLLATDGGRPVAVIAEEVQSGWRRLLSPAGLELPMPPSAFSAAAHPR